MDDSSSVGLSGRVPIFRRPPLPLHPAPYPSGNGLLFSVDNECQSLGLGSSQP